MVMTITSPKGGSRDISDILETGVSEEYLHVMYVCIIFNIALTAKPAGTGLSPEIKTHISRLPLKKY
jgi:hypothetical protein